MLRNPIAVVLLSFSTLFGLGGALLILNYVQTKSSLMLAGGIGCFLIEAVVIILLSRISRV